jgi:hypothetical protein
MLWSFVCAEEVRQLSAIPRSETARRKPDPIEVISMQTLAAEVTSMQNI